MICFNRFSQMLQTFYRSPASMIVTPAVASEPSKLDRIVNLLHSGRIIWQDFRDRPIGKPFDLAFRREADFGFTPPTVNFDWKPSVH